MSPRPSNISWSSVNSLVRGEHGRQFFGTAPGLAGRRIVHLHDS
jgi:hypothetical protein